VDKAFNTMIEGILCVNQLEIYKKFNKSIDRLDGGMQLGRSENVQLNKQKRKQKEKKKCCDR
jgi:hypothetical protein